MNYLWERREKEEGGGLEGKAARVKIRLLIREGRRTSLNSFSTNSLVFCGLWVVSMFIWEKSFEYNYYN